MKYNGHCYHYDTNGVPWFTAEVCINMFNISSASPLSSKQNSSVINEVYLEKMKASLEHFEDKCFNNDNQNNTISNIFKNKFT